MDKNIDELIKKHKINPALIKKWEKEGHFPFVLFSEKDLFLDNDKVVAILRVYNHPAVNRTKIINHISSIDNIINRGAKRIDEAKVYLEELNIQQLKNDLASFLDSTVSDTEVYKREMKAMLLDKRFLYRALREHTSYDTHRRWWREEKWHLIDTTLLQLEKDALQKLYDTLFPTSSKTYSISLSILDNQAPIQVSVEAKSREDAYALLKKNFPSSTFSINDLVESNSTYNRLEGGQDTFDYLPDVEAPNYIETDPTKFL